MAQERSPDGRLVYLHCSTIFNGANAQVRKAKKISQLLETHMSSIKILTEEFSLPAIAAVAKELLEEGIFASLPRARLRYPELFQPSETQEAERAASEAEVVRIEAEAAQDIILTSDDEGGDECLDVKESQQCAEPEGTLEDKVEAPDNVQTNAVELKQPTLQAHQALSIPRLHPVYLPFRTQHKILVSVQCLLEECCLEFGNTWVPDLMEARRWHEVESIELTQWTKRFLKYAKSLPPSAIKRISGKSIAQVLFGTSALRHSAVHRLPTSAAGTLNMIHAAMTFAEALNDPKRVERVEEIKTQLEASIDEIVQHQNLLERKLKEQLEDIARRRAELEELERSSIEEMLATDKEQRTAVGSALESFLFGSQQISNPCACNHTPSFDEAKAGSEAEHNMESSGTEHEPKLEPKLPETINEAQACDQSPLGEGEPHQLEELKEDIQPHQPEELKEDIPPHQPEELKEDIPPPWYDNNDGGIEEKPEVSALTLSTLSSKAKGKKDKKKGKVAASAWDVPAIEEDVIQPPWHENNDGGIEEKPEVSELTLSTLSSKGKDPKNKKKGKMAAFVWGIPAIEEDVIQPPWHENNDGGIEEKPEVSELTLSTLSSKGKSSKGKDSKNKKKGKVAASAWDIPAVEEQVTQPSWHDNNGGDVEEKPEVSVTLSTLKSIGKDPKNKKKGKGKGKVAASAWDIPAAEEAPVLVDEAPAPEEASPAPEHVYWRLPRYGAWNFGATRDVPAEPQNVVGESIQPEEPCPAASEEPSQPDEPYSIAAVEAPEPEDAFTARESVYNEDPMAAEIPASDATPEPSQAELVPKVSDDTEEHTLNQYDNVVHDLVDSYALAPAPDDAPMPSPPAEPTEFMAPPPKPALSAVRDELDLNHPRTPSAPPSTKTSVFEAAAAPEEAPTEDSHTITLKILHGSKVLRSIVFIKACTRTAILNEARAYCVKYARDDQSLATLLAKGYDLALMSMKMYGYDTDLSTYKVENLSSLVRAIEKTGIPRFTLRISEV